MHKQYINQQDNWDCLQATLANLLDIEYDTIPEFWKSYPIDKNGIDNLADDLEQSTSEFTKWLRCNGYNRILIDVEYNDNGTMLLPLFSSSNFNCIGYVPGNVKHSTHAVLVNIKDNNMVTIIHDPYVDSVVKAADIIKLDFIFKGDIPY